MNPKPEVTAIVFDLGGVLIDWNPRHLFRKAFAGDDERMELFLRDVCSQSWNERQDGGRSFRDAVEELSREHPDWSSMIRLYHERWPEMLGGPIHGTVEVLAELRGDGWPLYALTNWSAETFPHALARFEFLRWFDGIVVSGVEKMLKPEPRFFRLLLDRHGLEPGATLFIDDVERNVQGALSAGLRAVRFTGPEALRRELRELGILRAASPF